MPVICRSLNFVAVVVLLVLTFRHNVDSQIVLQYPYHRDVTYKNYFNCAPNGTDDPTYNQEEDPSQWVCGVCGNNVNDTVPRTNEFNGAYYRQYPNQKAAYIQGVQANVTFSVIHSELGYVDLRICSDSSTEIDNQDCFNQNLLQFVDVGSDTTEYTVEQYTINVNNKALQFDVTALVNLPDSLVCEACTMQIHYRSGLSAAQYWTCPTNQSTPDGLCQQQQTYFDCADLRILPSQTDIEQVANGNVCMSLPPSPSAQIQVPLGDCSTDGNTQLNRISALPKWSGNAGHNPFVIVFPLFSLCLQINDPTTTFGVTLEECTFAYNQNFRTIATSNSNEFQIYAYLYHGSPKSCLSAGGPGGTQYVTQEPCDPTNPAQLWTYQIQHPSK